MEFSSEFLQDKYRDNPGIQKDWRFEKRKKQK